MAKNIITSNRKFGVEIEAGCRNGEIVDILQSKMRGLAKLVGDASIKLERGVEFVTAPIVGTKGEDIIKAICKNLNEYDVITDNESCGLHVHLDAPEFLNKEEIIHVIQGGEDGLIKERGLEIKSLWEIPKVALLRHSKNPTIGTGIDFLKGLDYRYNDGIQNLNYYGLENIFVNQTRVEKNGLSIIKNTLGEVDRYDKNILKAFYEKDLDQVKRGSINKSNDDVRERYLKGLEALFKTNESRLYAKLDSKEPVARVKSLMYFLVLFNPVLQAMMPASRRVGNSFCMAFSDFFTLDQIKGINSYFDFEKLWYKDGDPIRIEAKKNDHYNDSRYLDYNLHSLFNRHQTIEVRIHPSTKDPLQVLMWTALHQHFVDKIAKGLVTFEMMLEIDNEMSIEEKFLVMVKLFELPEHLSEYVKRLINHFSNLNIK